MRRQLSCSSALGATPCRSSGISGTLSNFDVFNDTPTDSYGAELELEGVHSIDVRSTYPSHYDSKTITEYSDGTTFGTRIQFAGYNFDPSGFLTPTVGQNTNGHSCVNTPGCEHFGFSVGQQPTTTRFYWLDQDLQRIGSMPMSIPNPTWTYLPPARPGEAPIVRAEVEVPEPAEVHLQQPDSIWMKVYKTELERPVDLDELISNGGVVPEHAGETETEWELLEGNKAAAVEAPVGKGNVSVIRRYEFFKYTGPYDEEHEPTSVFLDQDLPEPPEGELGAFIASNMVAANLVDVQPLLGDFDGNGVLDAGDIDALTAEVRSGKHDRDFDLNGDRLIDQQDRSVWVNELRKSYFGDADLNGEFNSSDFVAVFQIGQYEDGVAGNSTWASGDWTGDGEFDSSDFVKAFQQGGYEKGPRAAVAAVPEPSALALAIIGVIVFAPFRRRGE